MGLPTLSVVMANYNYGQYISEAIEALVGQSFIPKEIIVVDDASTDGSVKIIEGYAKKYPMIKLFKNDKNMGPMRAFNRGIKDCSSEYLFLTASDDFVLPGFFEKSVGLLLKYPEAGICFTESILLSGSRYIENRKYLSDKPDYLSPHKVLKLFMRESSLPFSTHNAVFKFSAFKEAGGYLPVLKGGWDSFVCSVLSFRCGLCYIPEVLTVIREHSAQQGNPSLKKLELGREVIRNMIETVSTPAYSDVLPMFKQTAPFSFYPWEVLMEVLKKRSYWSFLSLKLLRFALFDKIIRRPLMYMLPTWLCRYFLRMFRNLRSRIMSFSRRG